MDERPKIIFLVEDNLGDIRLIQEVLKTTKNQCEVIVARDGMEAIACLQNRENSVQAIRPDLILLDLNLPKKDGREVLAEIKADQSLKHIPVVVLTTSRSEDDILKSYDLHVNCFISKSRNLRQLFSIVKGIEEFWLDTVSLPPTQPLSDP